MSISRDQYVGGMIKVTKPLGLECPACRAQVTGTFQVKIRPGGMTSEPEGNEVRYTINGDLVGVKFEHDCLPKVTRSGDTDR
jgi:hypothetical protein